MTNAEECYNQVNPLAAAGRGQEINEKSRSYLELMVEGTMITWSDDWKLPIVTFSACQLLCLCLASYVRTDCLTSSASVLARFLQSHPEQTTTLRLAEVKLKRSTPVNRRIMSAKLKSKSKSTRQKASSQEPDYTFPEANLFDQLAQLDIQENDATHGKCYWTPTISSRRSPRTRNRIGAATVTWN